MLYLLALLCPPLAVAASHKASSPQALFFAVAANVLLCVCTVWLGGAVHAWMTVNQYGYRHGMRA